MSTYNNGIFNWYWKSLNKKERLLKKLLFIKIYIYKLNLSHVPELAVRNQ